MTRDPSQQRQMLERQFARLFETLARHEIPVTLLWYPRLATDPAYLFRQLHWLLGPMDEAIFKAAFKSTVRPDWIHTFPGEDAPQPGASPQLNLLKGSPEEEATSGTAFYRDALRRIHTELEPSLYLEIGVHHGLSLALASCRAVGVDPAPEITVDLPATAEVVVQTSDDFFARADALALLGAAPELIFIDGLHLFEVALRDFIHAERLAPPHGLIVIDDIFPNHPSQAARERRTEAWTGDVWKLIDVLRQYRPGLELLALNTRPTGLLLVAGLDRHSTVLPEAYEAIVAKYAAAIEPSSEILERAEAISPTDVRVGVLLRRLRAMARPPH